ncbi:MAG: outer membrane beta-barrel protein [Fimbriimonadaceae bacterium]|nr:outer membrane beta-barrel protein [Chitinophagales bacterium]
MILGSFSTRAQAFEEGNSTISVGYGFPNLVGAIFNAYETYEQYDAKSLGPIFGKYEYAVSDNIGVGLNIGYSQTTVTYVLGTYNEEFKYSSLGILARINWHFGDSDNFDPYAGFGLGYRTGNYTFTSDDPNAQEVTLDTPIPFGMEITVGSRYFFTDNFGAYAELGFAKAPFQIGLVGKF